MRISINSAASPLYSGATVSISDIEVGEKIEFLNADTSSLSNVKWHAWCQLKPIVIRIFEIANDISPQTPDFQYHRGATWQVWRCVALAEVRIQEGEPLENALRRFKRKVQQEDIIKEVKRHSYYLKPGEKKRVKAALARKRNRKKARKEAD